MQREELPVMTTGLERTTVKARCEPKLRFTSLAHHLTKERVWENLSQIPAKSAAGVDGQTVTEAKESFEEWIAGKLQSVHREGYRAPEIRRVYIPKPGKQEMRPLGVPTVADRALQRSASQVLSAIYEQDFLSCSFGGRTGRGAHQALATLHERIAGGKIEWVLEADIKNFFGSLSHEWMLRFVEHRVGDQRLISLIRRWLKAGVLENGEIHPSEEGTPQGGSISVLLSNVYLHYVLDLWFERVVKPRLRGEACMMRYIDDFVLCFQYRADALRVQEALAKRLRKFSLTLEPTKTKLVEFGRYAHRHASKRGRKRPETIYFLGFTLYCTRNQKGNFRIGFAYGKVTTATRADAVARPDAADAALVAPGTGESSQSNAPRSLYILWHCRESSGIVTGPSGRGALLAQNVEHSELGRRDPVGAIPANQGTVPAATTKGVSPLQGAASYRHTVKQLLKNVVRQSARYVLWEPEAGNCLRPPGGRSAMVVPTATVA